MASQSTVIGWSGAALTAALMLGSGSASGQQLPAPTGSGDGVAITAASSVAPTAEPGTPWGCPYSARWSGHGCCCHHGYGGRIGITATSALVLGAAVVFHVLAIDRGAEANRLYDMFEPNHTAPPAAYSDVAALNGQRQTFQDWSIGLYVTGGILTAMSAIAWLAPLHWRGRNSQYAPQVALGPNRVALTLTF